MDEKKLPQAIQSNVLSPSQHEAFKRMAGSPGPPPAQANGLRLNLGAGGTEIPGYTPVEIKAGEGAYPLKHPDGAAEVIRASHVLEHFSHRDTPAVLADWVRVLAPGGVLKIAVPDLDKIVDMYRDGPGDKPVEGYLMGGHVDAHDVHLAIFNAQKLTGLMQAVGLTDIRPWTSEIRDCAALPVSLNLQGTKGQPEQAARKVPVRAPGPQVPSGPQAPAAPRGLTAGPQVPSGPQARGTKSPLPMKVKAAMSAPRLGFMDNYFCAFEALLPLKIGLRKHSGAFWGQCLERCMGECIAEGAEAILVIDYDTIFRRQDVEDLVGLMEMYPAADAIAPLQANRTKDFPLLTMKGADGATRAEVTRDMFRFDLRAIATAHFGLTLIRVASLATMPHPWFHSRPNENGMWEEGRIDDDMWFWKQWERAGHSLYLANRVLVGHAELMIRWLSKDMTVIHQHPSVYHKTGKPEGVWI